MQTRFPPGWRGAGQRHPFAATYIIPLFDQVLLIEPVDRVKICFVLQNNDISVAIDSVAAVDNFSRFGGCDTTPRRSGDLDPLAGSAPGLLLLSMQKLAFERPLQFFHRGRRAALRCRSRTSLFCLSRFGSP